MRFLIPLLFLSNFALSQTVQDTVYGVGFQIIDFDAPIVQVVSLRSIRTGHHMGQLFVVEDQVMFVKRDDEWLHVWEDEVIWLKTKK